MRKDFILEPYQVDESRWLGADAVLLIVRVLDEATLRSCADRAADIGMTALVEVHADEELETALAVPGAVIGINHRDLDAQQLDMQRTFAGAIPTGKIQIAITSATILEKVSLVKESNLLDLKFILS